MTGYRKKEIVNMAQENLHMFKRLKEKSSCYDFNKYDKEYDQSQYYKKFRCSFLPSINFNKNKRKGPMPTKKNFLYQSNYDYINQNNYNMNINNSNNNTINNEHLLFNNK